MNSTEFLKIAENVAERAKVELDLSKFNRFAEIDAEGWLATHETAVSSEVAVEMRIAGDEDGSVNGMKPVRPENIKREAVIK